MYPETILPIAAHIPHAGTTIPDSIWDQFIPFRGELWKEMAMVTDWYTDQLFGLPGIAITQTPISRVVVDTERFLNDVEEEKAAIGQGVIYTHDSLGNRIRHELSVEDRRMLLDQYYRPWHLQLAQNIEQQKARWGYCLLLDCHSFPEEPFPHENDGALSRPDICLGCNENTSPWLLEAAETRFLQRGYSVAVNFPYASCLVPQRFHGDPRVPAIMIEINRGLYLKPAPRDAYRLGNTALVKPEFERVRNDIWGVMLELVRRTSAFIAA